MTAEPISICRPNIFALKVPVRKCRGIRPKSARPCRKRDVGIIEVLPVGNYAVRLVFDDMHSTGIFDWEYLFKLGRNYATYWQDYLDELAVKNLTRDPPMRRK